MKVQMKMKTMNQLRMNSTSSRKLSNVFHRSIHAIQMLPRSINVLYISKRLKLIALQIEIYYVLIV